MFGQGNNFTAAAGGGSQSAGGQQRRINPIRPLTIKQLLEAQSVGQGVMVVDGREVTQATVMGRVIGYENANMTAGGQALTAKYFGYRISDHTGALIVRQWVQPNSPEQPLPLHTHVRASGSVKVWQDAPVVTGTVVSVADSNELNYHALDAILTHLRLTQGNKRPTGVDGAAVMNTASAIGARNLLPGGDTKVLLTDLLVSVIRQAGNGDMGLSMDEMAAAAQRYSFGPNDVRAALRTLASEGKVYQTHDNRFNV